MLRNVSLYTTVPLSITDYRNLGKYVFDNTEDIFSQVSVIMEDP